MALSATVAHVDDLTRLALAAREGDDHATAEFVRRTQPAVWRLCAALGSGSDTEDLVQDTYLRAVRGLPSFRADSPVLPWLLAIARHVCADQVRRRQRFRKLVDRIAAQPATTAPEPSGIDCLLAGLSLERREAFVLTQVLGLSYEEAALAIGCPVGTVRSRVARARADLFAAVRDAEASG